MYRVVPIEYHSVYVTRSCVCVSFWCAIAATSCARSASGLDLLSSWAVLDALLGCVVVLQAAEVWGGIVLVCRRAHRAVRLGWIGSV